MRRNRGRICTAALAALLVLGSAQTGFSSWNTSVSGGGSVSVHLAESQEAQVEVVDAWMVLSDNGTSVGSAETAGEEEVETGEPETAEAEAESAEETGEETVSADETGTAEATENQNVTESAEETASGTKGSVSEESDSASAEEDATVISEESASGSGAETEEESESGNKAATDAGNDIGTESETAEESASGNEAETAENNGTENTAETAEETEAGSDSETAADGKETTAAVQVSPGRAGIRSQSLVWTRASQTNSQVRLLSYKLTQENGITWEGTDVSFPDVTLSLPGAWAEYFITVKNTGSADAVLEEYKIPTGSDVLESYIPDGYEAEAGEVLKAGETRTFAFVVWIPSSYTGTVSEIVDLDYTLTYSGSDSGAGEVEEAPKAGYRIDRGL